MLVEQTPESHRYHGFDVHLTDRRVVEVTGVVIDRTVAGIKPRPED
jgi:hypothetical protein